MEKFWLTVLRINLIATPFIFGWVAYEYAQTIRNERELYKTFAETEKMLNDMKKKF